MGKRERARRAEEAQARDAAEREGALARRARIAALVMAGAGLLTIGAPLLTFRLGADPRWEMLCYLLALAAFFWSLVETWTIWQRRKGDRG